MDGAHESLAIARPPTVCVTRAHDAGRGARSVLALSRPFRSEKGEGWAIPSPLGWAEEWCAVGALLSGAAVLAKQVFEPHGQLRMRCHWAWPFNRLGAPLGRESTHPVSEVLPPAAIGVSRRPAGRRPYLTPAPGRGNSSRWRSRCCAPARPPNPGRWGSRRSPCRCPAGCRACAGNTRGADTT